MKKPFFDISQARSYLTQSVIMLGDEPIYVTNVDGSSRSTAIFYRLLGNDASVKITDYEKNGQINTKPVPLGLMNFRFDDKRVFCAMVGRFPRRGWKVGLTTGNMSLVPAAGSMNILHKGDIIVNSALRQTIVRKYPAISTARKYIKQGIAMNTIAVSPQFSIGADNKVFYRTKCDPVGVLQNGYPELMDDFSWLKELLEEELNDAN